MSGQPSLNDTLTACLPVFSRLALSYAPAQARQSTLALMALDARLAAVLRSASEPVMAQLRLSWRRVALASSAEGRPRGEPLLALFDGWQAETAGLLGLVDGWEELTAEPPLPTNALAAFLEGRAMAFCALARHLGEHASADEAARCAKEWALADLAARLSDPQEGEAVLALAQEQRWVRARLPRSLRPLAILHGLAARQMRKGRLSASPGAASLLVAMRIGLAGR